MSDEQQMIKWLEGLGYVQVNPMRFKKKDCPNLSIVTAKIFWDSLKRSMSKKLTPNQNPI
jgi:hypothetical protein